MNESHTGLPAQQGAQGTPSTHSDPHQLTSALADLAFAPTPHPQVVVVAWQPSACVGVQAADLLKNGCVVTIGNFDGAHRGHQVLLEQTRQIARARAIPSVAITFDPHPLQVLAAQQAPALLSTVSQRIQLLAQCGVDAVLVVPFSAEMARWAPQRFIDEVLVGRLNAQAVCVGQDFRFGCQASGSVDTLRECGSFQQVCAVPLADDEQASRLSASRARRLISDGEVERAAAVLGRPFQLEGVVERGHQRGRALGFPTANVALDAAAGLQLPADGVYAGTLAVLAPPSDWPSWADVGATTGLRLGDWAAAAISVGTNPTFDGVNRQVEAYVLDRDDLQLYGWQVGVRFVSRLRPTLRFTSVEELVQAMHHDVDQARVLLDPP